MNVIPAVRRQVVVEASAEHAFRVFTDGIDKWWPRQHHIGKSPLRRAVIEPKVGGRWYAISEDDTQCDTGRVLVWDPPRRLVMTWQITAQWTFDPDFVTEVEVTFVPEGPKKTRVELEHRDLERYGDVAKEFRTAIDADSGWGLIMQDFVKAANA